jgi:hypothetical protein
MSDSESPNGRMSLDRTVKARELPDNGQRMPRAGVGCRARFPGVQQGLQRPRPEA